MKFIVTEHAKFELDRRGIHEDVVKNTINQPQQIISTGKSRSILQSKYYDSTIKKEMLLRIIGKKINSKFIVITAYKTSKIKKYWVTGGKQNEGNI